MAIQWKNFTFHLAVKIDLVEVVYDFKLKHVFPFLSNPYDKSVMAVDPLVFLNVIDVEMLHFLHQHQLLLVFFVPRCQIYILSVCVTWFFYSNFQPILTRREPIESEFVFVLS